MNLDQLRDQTCASLALLLPQVEGDVSRLVDECLSDARKCFRDDFICQLSPRAWAKITLIYCKHFLDTGCEVSIGEIVAAVLRDSIRTSRIDMLTLQLAQEKMVARMDAKPAAVPVPHLHVVRE